MATGPSKLALEFTGLADVDEVAPFNEADTACFDELKSVLAKHNALGRFGIALLHSHFPVFEGEVLVERCDPVRLYADDPAGAEGGFGEFQLVETNWRLDAEDASRYCYRECIKAGDSHITHHTEH